MIALAVAAAGHLAIGAYGGWAAFRDAQPARCYAIALPVAAARAGFASVGNWPARGVRNALHIRLSHSRAPAVAVTLAVGERRFALVGRGADAWAADPASDRAIVAAMRGQPSMSVETVAAGGGAFADVYALAGAATAIDAAALACVAR